MKEKENLSRIIKDTNQLGIDVKKYADSIVKVSAVFIRNFGSRSLIVIGSNEHIISNQYLFAIPELLKARDTVMINSKAI